MTIKIAIVTPSFPPKVGGIATSHYNLFHLLKREYHVKAFAYDDDDPTPFDNVVRRKTPRWLGLALAWAARCYLRRFDKTCAFSACANIARISWSARSLNAPLRRFAPDLVLVPDNTVPGYYLRKPVGSKLVWYARNNYKRFRNNPLLVNTPWADMDVASSLERKAIHKADALISPSSYMIDEITNAFGKLDIPMRVIHNFMTPEVFDAIEAFPLHKDMGLEHGIPIVYIPSAGSHNKGRRYTFEIIRRIHAALNARVGFFLSGPIPGDIRFELATISPTPHVHCPGHIPWTDNVARVKACALCVSPTLVENFSNAIVEAMWSGVPVVTFDTGGNKEIVYDGENGHVVDYLDVDNLIHKASALLLDRERLNNFGKTAMATTQRLLSPTMILKQYQTFFTELTNNGK